MHEPSGPRSPEVYWRRRTLAVCGTGAAVLLFIWVVAALLGTGSNGVRGAANERADGMSLAAPSSSSPPPISSSARPSASPSATPSPMPSPTPSPAPPPGPPGPCPDTAIKVSTSTDEPNYAVGERPELTLHVTNISKLTCVRDVSHQLRALRVVPVSAPANTLWASNDCYLQTNHDVRTLQPGEDAAFSVAWAGRTAGPGCPTDRHTVPAGQYAVIGSLGPINSAPTPFALH